MSIIHTEYDDIMNEILPNIIVGSLNFRNAKDIRLAKNDLMKTFKRLGIIVDED